MAYHTIEERTALGRQIQELKEGDKIRIKLLSIEGGKYSLSRKALIKDGEPAETVEEGD